MGSKGSNTTTTNTAPNAQALSAYQDLLTRAGGVASTPYQAYTGELVAPVNQQQYTGIGGVNQYANAAQPAISQALGQAASSSAPLNASTIQQYESPYTQQVVNATQAQFNNQNQQQQQQVVGNAIAQGALGGNRSAIAQSELANQQQLAQAPVIANLENQGYSQAVQTAEQQQQTGLQGANAIGNLGVAGQTAGLTGAQSQIGAGTLEQQTQQALDAANYGQYQAQQAYPYQQLSWLAGLDTGVGSQMGGTSSTTAPAPTLFQQLAGLGTAGVGLLGGTGAFGATGYLNPSYSNSIWSSSKEVKENIKCIGKTHDGQNLYIYNYKGDPTKHIGLIAENVEKKHPHAVHEINGTKAVDIDKATKDSQRANGGVVGYASGGTIPDTPWSGGVSYIPPQAMPSLGITHGRGAPSPPGVNNQGQQNLNQSVAQIGNMAKTLKDSMNGNNPLTSGPAWGGGSAAAGDVYGGSAAAPLPGLNASDYGPMARGGVAGFADGGSPDTDNTDVINPDEPYRMADPAAVEAWRNGTDNVNQPKIQPESQSSSDLPVSQGVAPSTMQYAASRKSDPSLPSEINTGSSTPTYSDGVSPPTSSGPDIDWSSNSKLWPALMSAGFGMMASRSPFAGVAIGEGGQAGLKTYGEEQQREFEAQKTAAELQRQADAERRAEEQQKISAMNQMIITGPNGKPMVNPDYIKAKQDIEREWQPKPIVIGTNTRGDPVQGYWDPNTKKAYDLSGHPVVTGPSGAIIPWGQEGNNGQTVPTPNNTNTTTPPPIKSPAPVTAQNQPAPFSDRFNGLPSSPLNATAQAPVKVASIDPSFTPTPLSRVQQQAGYQTITQAEPHEADPRAPLGTEESRNTKFMADIAKQDPGYALALQKAANYELDPGKYASLQKGKREHFINDVLQYDPNYVPQEVGLRYRAQTAFLPGTKTGDTIGSFNTAISHLDVLKELYHNLNNPDMRVLAKIRNDWNTYWKGEAMPNTVAGIAQMVSGEVVKATVGAQNALGDREEAAKTVNRDLSTMQADDVIDKYERLMGGKLETARFQYHQSTGLKNFDDKFLLPRSQEVMKQVIAETGKHSSGHTEMTPQDHQALDWANSHPDDPRAAAIKKKLGQ